MKYKLTVLLKDLGRHELPTGSGTGDYWITRPASAFDWLKLSLIAFVLWVIALAFIVKYILGMHITILIDKV